MYYSEDDYGLGCEANDVLNRLIQAGYRFNFSDVNSRDVRHMYKDDINVYISFHTNKGKSYVDSMQCVKNEVGIATTYKKKHMLKILCNICFAKLTLLHLYTFREKNQQSLAVD